VDLVEMKNQRAINRLRDEAERVKTTLSSSQRANIDLDALFEGMDFKTSLTRARFESIVTSLFSKCLNAVSDLLNNNGLVKQDIDNIVLVGGTTMIPKLQDKVKQFFEKVRIMKNY
jgi:heat shock protein 1/8